MYFIHLRGLALRLIHRQPSVRWLVSEATSTICEEVLRAGSTKNGALPVADQIPAILLRQAFHLVPEWRKPREGDTRVSLCDLEVRARKALWGDKGDWTARIERVACRLLTYLGVPEGVARTVSTSDDLCQILSTIIEVSR